MIRLLLVLLVLGGSIYLVMFRDNGQGETELHQYEESVEKVDAMEQQLLESARERQEKVNEMAR